MAGADMPKFREINLAHTVIMRPYQAGDGRWLQFNMVRSEEFLALMFAGLDALHLLADERFATAELMMENRRILGDLVQEIIARKDSTEWLAIFADLGVPVNRIARVEEAVTDPQVLLNGMAEPAMDTLGMPLVVKHPIRVSSAPQVRPVRAPELGEHSAEILREIGYDETQIAALRERGAI
jgi:formyl-CoA transferase